MKKILIWFLIIFFIILLASVALAFFFEKQIGDQLDHSTGIEFLVGIGDKIEKGQPIANVFCDSKASQYAVELVGAAIGISDHSVDPPVLIVDSY